MKKAQKGGATTKDTAKKAPKSTGMFEVYAKRREVLQARKDSADKAKPSISSKKTGGSTSTKKK